MNFFFQRIVCVDVVHYKFICLQVHPFFIHPFWLLCNFAQINSFFFSLHNNRGKGFCVFTKRKVQIKAIFCSLHFGPSSVFEQKTTAVYNGICISASAKWIVSLKLNSFFSPLPAFISGSTPVWYARWFGSAYANC